MTEEIELIKTQWKSLQVKLKTQFEEEPDLQVMLFLIGVQELGQGHRAFSKDEKQNLMHIATCRVLSEFGYYAFDHTDEDGWPHYRLVMEVPAQPLGQQDMLLRKAVIRYFQKNGIL